MYVNAEFNLEFQAGSDLFRAVYVNALLATLNARPRLREQNADGVARVSIPLTVTTTTVRTVETSEPDSFHKDSRYDAVCVFS